jgi:hypothetical protein
MTGTSADTAASATPARSRKRPGRRHNLTPEESRAIDIVVEEEREAGGWTRGRKRPLLDLDRIVEWAVEHQARTGSWPSPDSGAVTAAAGAGETWRGISIALRRGTRGLPGGTTLPRLLAERVGKPFRPAPVVGLTVDEILVWADAYYGRTGQWPSAKSGAIAESPSGDTWASVNAALRMGGRGLPAPGPGDSFVSLARLLADRHGGKLPRYAPPSLTVEMILAWADSHVARTGSWPIADSGPVVDAPGETWVGIDAALFRGGRGLPAGQSLKRLLQVERGIRNVKDLPSLSEEQILIWADAYHERTGQWPHLNSGVIRESPDQVTWLGVDAALKTGARGLGPSGAAPATLLRFLERARGVPTSADSKRLTEERILAWADAYRERTGHWPTRRSGDIAVTDGAAPGDTWSRVNAALRLGGRGLPGGSSLAQLLRQARSSSPTPESPHGDSGRTAAASTPPGTPGEVAC